MMHFRDFGLLTLAALAVPAVVQAADAKAIVDGAKATGLVGEQADGFLGFVKPVSDPALKEAVREINEGRAALYRQAAAKNGVTPEAAGASAYTTIVQSRLKPGEYYKPAGGSWVRK
jgi:uncharacterized protein YdbL (DUF1318 family)